MKCLVCSSPIEDSVDLCLKCAPGFWENTRQAIEAMSIVREYPEVWPVIHVENHETALANATIAAQAKAEGIFLIQMHGNDDLLDPLIYPIRQQFPQLKVGFNFLSLSPLEALRRSLQLGADATWTDRPGVRSDGVSVEAEDISALLLQHSDHLFFASIAFKYQPVDPNPWLAAQKAYYLGMIPTTSGEATGMAPAAEKLRLIKKGQSSLSLALASGITADNVGEFLPYLTHCLVSTGISHDFEHFDAKKLQQLVDRVRLDVASLF